MRSEPPSPEEILAQIAAELAEPQYRMGTPWWERVIEWLTRAWIVFVEWLTEISDLVGGPLVLASIVAVVLGGAIAAITVNLGRRRARRIDERLRREHEAVRGLDPVDLDRRAAEAEPRATTPRRCGSCQAGLIRPDRRADRSPGDHLRTVASPRLGRVRRAGGAVRRSGVRRQAGHPRSPPARRCWRPPGGPAHMIPPSTTINEEGRCGGALVAGVPGGGREPSPGASRGDQRPRSGRPHGSYVTTLTAPPREGLDRLGVATVVSAALDEIELDPAGTLSPWTSPPPVHVLGAGGDR